MNEETIIKGEKGGSSSLLSLVDVNEQYGRHVITSFAKSLKDIRTVCDFGVGLGGDLSSIKTIFSEAEYYGVDFSKHAKSHLENLGIILKVQELEHDEIDLKDNSIDLVIANQVFEHLKELYWVFHQITKKLKLGGHLIIGVPNICALHNRILFNFGVQPSQMKSYSAHIRGFGPREIPKFLEICFPDGYQLKTFRGSQFYPFPKQIARILCKLFPGLSHSVFYLLQKTKEYDDEFIKHPEQAKLNSNFFTGN